MININVSLPKDYWKNLQINEEDLNFLYNYLLDKETPLTVQELANAFVEERIRSEKARLEDRNTEGGALYTPKETYQIGQDLIFPALNWARGKVVEKRPSNNPEEPPFEVIQVTLENSDTRLFASAYTEHRLNEPLSITFNDPQLDIKAVSQEFGKEIRNCLNTFLESNPELIRIADRWFPRALLVDINKGYLNLAEATLDMAGGKSMTTKSILEQVELPTDVNSRLTEFSMNYALQEDGRFDEVGPVGEILWYLKRLEPLAVQQIPAVLHYYPPTDAIDTLSRNAKIADPVILDELDGLTVVEGDSQDVCLCLLYPHWRAGTLPLGGKITRLFPTAHDAPRVQFTFVEADGGKKFPGWVVRPGQYIYGLREWYSNQGLIPGSLIYLSRSKNPGEVKIRIEKRRQNREWIRTVMVGSDGGIVFALLKQVVNATFHERMAIAIPNVDALDTIWEQGVYSRSKLGDTVDFIMNELSKLNPQGNVHVLEVYAALNILRRCPPSVVIQFLLKNSGFTHLGDLNFRCNEEITED